MKGFSPSRPGLSVDIVCENDLPADPAAIEAVNERLARLGRPPVCVELTVGELKQLRFALGKRESAYKRGRTCGADSSVAESTSTTTDHPSAPSPARGRSSCSAHAVVYGDARGA